MDNSDHTAAEHVSEQPAEVRINWPEPLAPDLAAGIVRATAAAGTVPSNGYNSWHKYHFPKPCDIKDAARECLVAGGLALPFQYERVEPWPRCLPAGDGLLPNPTPVGVLVSGYRLVHESGHGVDCEVWTPIFSEKGRPYDKAKNAAATNGLKYLVAQLFGIGWDDPTDDPSGRNDSGPAGGRGNKPGKGARNRQSQPQPQPQAPPPPPMSYDVVYSALRRAAMEALKFAERLGMDHGRSLELATGLKNGMAKGMKPSQLLAVREFGQVLRHMDSQSGNAPREHREVLAWLSTNGHTALWSAGKPSARAIQYDESMESQRKVPWSGGDPAFPSVQPSEPDVPGDEQDLERAAAGAGVAPEQQEPEPEPQEGVDPDGTRFDPETGEVIPDDDDVPF